MDLENLKNELDAAEQMLRLAEAYGGGGAVFYELKIRVRAARLRLSVAETQRELSACLEEHGNYKSAKLFGWEMAGMRDGSPVMERGGVRKPLSEVTEIMFKEIETTNTY